MAHDRPVLADASRLAGDTVDVITGASLAREVDFVLGGRSGIHFVRHYTSVAASLQTGLGHGHRHGFDERLCFDVDGMRYEHPDGRVVTFPFLLRDGAESASCGYLLQRVHGTTFRIIRGSSAHTFHMHASGLAQLVERVDGERATRFHYGPRGELAGITTASHAVALIWDERRIVRAVWTDPPDREPRALMRYGYDARGRLTQGTDAYERTFRLVYDDGDRVIARTDVHGYTIQLAYDAAGRCTETRGADGRRRTTIRHEREARLTRVTKPSGGEWLYFYDERDSLLQVLDPYGGATVFRHDERGRVLASVDPAGCVTSCVDHTPEEPEALHSFDDPRTRGGIDLRALNGMDASPLAWELGARGVAQPITLPTYATHIPSVDALAENALVRASAAGVGRYAEVRDVCGHLLAKRRADGAERRYLRDAGGRVRAFVDATGRTFRREHTSCGLLESQVDPLGHTVRYAYDASPQLTSSTDACGTTSAFEYDLKERLVAIYRDGLLFERYAYDGGDGLLRKEGADGAPLLQLARDASGQVVERELAAGERQLLRRDERGRIVQADGAAGSCTFAYDERGVRALDLRDGLGVRHAGEREGTREVELLGRFVIRERDQDAHTRLITDPTGGAHVLVRHGFGVFTRQVAAGFGETAQYDGEGRCLMKLLEHPVIPPPNVAVWDVAAPSPWQRRYHYSAEGDLLRRDDSERGPTTYEHDAKGRLRATVRLADTPPSRDAYLYDAADNLLRMPGLAEHETAPDGAHHPGDRSVVLDGGNRLYRARGERFVYDARERLVRRERAGEIIVRYDYDSADQLVAIEGPRLTWRATYDVLGRRTEKTVNGARWRYYWDGDRLAAELMPCGRVRLFVYADRRALVPLSFVEYASVTADPASGSVYHLFGDHLGCPEKVLDAAGRLVWHAEIEPYGRARVVVGRDFHQPLRWPGHFVDAETGLHYNRFRYYDPSLGRYLQPNPQGIAGGLNLHAYAHNPLRHVILRGLSTTRPDGLEGEERLDRICDPDPSRRSIVT